MMIFADDREEVKFVDVLIKDFKNWVTEVARSNRSQYDISDTARIQVF